MRKKLQWYLSFLALLMLLLCGCQSASISASGGTPDSAAETLQAINDESEKFDAFTEDLFADMVSTDALTLNYALKTPSDYDIELETWNLGRIDLDAADKSVAETKEIINQLHNFTYDNLTEEQQLTYDILDQYFQTELSYDTEALFLYPECFGGTSGTQTMLPILMSEFKFSYKQDVEIYLTLLEDFSAYFDNLMAYEKAKAEAGLFMSDESLDEAIAACRSFIENREDNMLIELFPDKLDAVQDLNDDEKAAYIERNRQAVLESVIPAYEKLIDDLEAMRGSGSNEYGLYYFENGQEYYRYLVETKTGTDKTPEELISLLETTMTNDLVRLSLLLSADESLYDDLNNFTDIELNDSSQMLTTLLERINSYFPELSNTNHLLKYIPECLEDSTNPAFYIIPQVDDPFNNVIYINNSKLTDNLSTFTTLAHEGYPGHLYQHLIFAGTNPKPIRQELSFLGYVEGWATYAENLSYQLAGLDNGIARCFQLNQEITLCLYARIDIGIHYEGWTEEDVLAFLTEYGIEDADAAHEVFRIIVTDPASYLPYCIGFLEFQSLREEAKEALGNDFDLKEFHEFILESGPCQFNILEKYMEKNLIIS